MFSGGINMKKVLKIFCVVLVISFGCSLAACSKNADETNTTKPEGAQSTSSAESSESIIENQTESLSEDEMDVSASETTEIHYNHSAIQGCVIIEQDGTPTFCYSEKCESCGYVSASAYTINHFGGSYTSGFHCPQCGNQQKVELNTNTY